MDILYTDLTLLKYHYAETDLFETLEIEHALEEDFELRMAYRRLKADIASLPKAMFSPSQTSVQRILEYSRK